jgi:outer membrane protein assembly factor BamD (BamD/ComL family)
MRTDTSKCFLDRKCFFMPLLVCITASAGLAATVTAGSKIDAGVVDFADFGKAVEAWDDVKAISMGDSLFGRLEEKYKGDAGFRAYKSKLNAAEFLAKQMQQQLKKATNAQLFAVADELFHVNSQGAKPTPLSVAPAKRFYETSIGLFSKPVRIATLTDVEKSFLAQYYDLNLRGLTSAIAKAGQALAVAEPTFKGTHDYVLVLPLLHATDKKSVNVDVLPRWMQRPEQLAIFSDSCLLHFGSPFHAMMVAKKSAQVQKRAFSELDFYRSTAKKYGKSYPHVAADCLHKAIDYVPVNESNMTVALQFEIVQLWLNSGTYALAAGQARKIFETYPDHKESGRAIWLYYYALSRNNNTNEILMDIDKALDDKRCEAYKAKLMYIKWWALRRKRDQAARVAALEFELLKQYGHNPMVAPILLSRATDLLASQNYNDAYQLLSELVEEFPSTKAAAQAKRMLAKLKTVKGTE